MVCTAHTSLPTVLGLRWIFIKYDRDTGIHDTIAEVDLQPIVFAALENPSSMTLLNDLHDESGRAAEVVSSEKSPDADAPLFER